VLACRKIPESVALVSHQKKSRGARFVLVVFMA
jgi:hypothetical protein